MIQELDATDVVLYVDVEDVPVLGEFQFVLQMVPHHGGQVVVATIQHLHDQLILRGDVFGDHDELQDGPM